MAWFNILKSDERMVYKICVNNDIWLVAHEMFDGSIIDGLLYNSWIYWEFDITWYFIKLDNLWKSEKEGKFLFML